MVKWLKWDCFQVANTNIKPPRIDTRSENIQIDEAEDHKAEYGASSGRSVRQLEKFIERDAPDAIEGIFCKN